MDLTTSQLEIWAMFRNGSRVSLDDIMEKVPGLDRHAALQRVKALTAKVAEDGWYIKRVTGVGRGIRGQWQAVKTST